MVVIRLARGGSKKKPFYHLVVADKRMPRDGRYIEKVGHFNPMAAGNSVKLHIDLARTTYWISKGAQPSERVASLLKQYSKQSSTESSVAA
jgi:small subunit ribosomal protein S16